LGVGHNYEQSIGRQLAPCTLFFPDSSHFGALTLSARRLCFLPPAPDDDSEGGCAEDCAGGVGFGDGHCAGAEGRDLDVVFVVVFPGRCVVLVALEDDLRESREVPAALHEEDVLVLIPVADEEACVGGVKCQVVEPDDVGEADLAAAKVDRAAVFDAQFVELELRARAVGFAVATAVAAELDSGPRGS